MQPFKGTGIYTIGAGKSSYGLPPPFIPKQLVSLSGDRQLLIHSHLLEFCSSLCTLASLPTAIQWALSEIVSACVIVNFRSCDYHMIIT